MKWAAGILVAALYLVWPYYTLIELAQAIQTVDAPTINRLVDWQRVRTSVKSQLQAQLDTMPKTAAEQQLAKGSPGAAAIRQAFAVSLASTVIDKMLTPEGIARLAQVSHARTRSGRSTRVTRRKRDASLWQRVGYAFFVSPIHFQLDLREPGRTRRKNQPVVTVMLMFKGTGWQVTDVRLPNQLTRSPSRRAAVTRHHR